MMKKRFISLSLAFMTAAGMLASCGDSTSQTENTTADNISDSTTAPVTTEEYTKPDKTFNGQDVNILIWSNSNLPVEEENGDVINDSVYRRNNKVSDLFDVKLKFDVRDGAVADYATWISTLNSSILAGDDAYQLAGGYGYRLTSDSLNGNYQNLKNNPYIDFTNPWWPSTIIKASDIGGNMFACIGNIEPLYYDMTYAIYFNKKIADEFKIDDIYKMVNDGTWTLDKMFELAENSARDLNGNSKIDENDQYGYLTDEWMCYDAFIHACDIKITETGSDGYPKLIGLTERFVDAQKKISEFMNSSGVVGKKSGGDRRAMFGDGKSLFLADSLHVAHILRAMSDDFGIVPYPKFDEAQDGYHTYNALGNSTVFVVPVTADETLAGCLLEALAYYGWKDVLPEYYERALKGKAARDNDSEAMLDIIFNNIEYEFTEIYSCSFGDQKSPSMTMRISIGENRDLASLWASDENLYDETMKSLINTLK